MEPRGGIEPLTCSLRVLSTALIMVSTSYFVIFGASHFRPMNPIAPQFAPQAAPRSPHENTLDEVMHLTAYGYSVSLLSERASQRLDTATLACRTDPVSEPLGFGDVKPSALLLVKLHAGRS